MQSTSSSLKEIEKNKAMVLVFSQTGISKDISDLNIGFKHIGALFNIQVKNIGTNTLDKVTQARLTASSTIPAYSNSGTDTYNLTTGTFSGSQPTRLTFLPISSSNIVSQGILEFWAWVPMEKGGATGAAWPALGLQIVSDRVDITTTTTKDARYATVGKTYCLYATYDGSALDFATEAEMTVAAGKLADFRDGNLYNTVTIGSQTWMQENLAYLPAVTSPGFSLIIPYYFVIGNTYTVVGIAKNTDNYKTYGALYNWCAMMAGEASSASNPSGVQGVCPTGWHLPSDAEWTQMEAYLANHGYNYDGSIGYDSSSYHGPREKIAKSLATDYGWKYDNGTLGEVGNTLYPGYRNKSGFSALPGNGITGYFPEQNREYGYWWTCTEREQDYAYSRRIHYWYSSVERLSTGTYATAGFSVRCIKDKD